MSMSGPLVLSFVARSGTGKTTYLEALLPELCRRGVRVMVIKHDVHGFEVDKEGKDTWRLSKAGASRVLIANAEKMALMGRVDGDTPLRELVARYGGGMDLVITEGYRRSGMPKILVARQAAPSAFDPHAPEVSEAIAAVTDFPLELDPVLPQLPLNDPAPCADLIVALLRRTAPVREVTGVILAGGASRRMGQDKSELLFRGSPLLPQLVERLLPLFGGGLLVVRRDTNQSLPSLPAGARVVDDLLPEHAALGGLYTGLALAPTPYVFLSACDMPLLDPRLVSWLTSWGEANSDVILPLWQGFPQPLHAIYSHRCLAAIKESLLSGEFRMDGWHGSVRVQQVPEEVWAEVHPSGHSFRGVNTPEELFDCENGPEIQTSSSGVE